MDAPAERTPIWPSWTAPRLRAAVGVQAASLVLGTLCAWLCLRLGFRRFQEAGWDSAAGPLALGAGAIAYLGGPGFIAWARGRWTPWILLLLAAPPVAAVGWFVVLSGRR